MLMRYSRVGVIAITAILAAIEVRAYDGVQPDARPEGESTLPEKGLADEVRRRVTEGSVDSAIDLLSGVAATAERDAALAVLLGSSAYQARSRSQGDLVRRAMEAGRSGKVDVARALFGAATRIRTASPPEEQALAGILAELEIPELAPPQGANSSQMDLAEFARRWANILAGQDDLDFEMAEYAKSIERESLCGPELDAFEQADCSKFQHGLRRAIKEGFRRRLIVSRPSVSGEYNIAAARWRMSVRLNGFGNQIFGIGSPFQMETPRVCEMFCGGTMLCQEKERGERFDIPMAPAEARSVVKSYADAFTAIVAAEIVREGSRRLSSCATTHGPPSAFARPYYVYRVVGVRLTNSSGQTWATGIFK